MYPNSDHQKLETNIEDAPWSDLPTLADVDRWIAQHDQTLQQMVGKLPSSGHGVRFIFGAGGALHLHTTSDGDIILDVEPDAAWITPVIVAATRVPAPVSRLWVLPGDVMIQLIFGLNPLIASSRPVIDHRFRVRQPY